jgi:hypothetical protein
LGFEPADDYLGIRNDGDAGDDVVVWLFPIVDDQEVDHHPGPFHALRLSYSVLRNPVVKAAVFHSAVEELGRVFGVPGEYSLRGTRLGSPADLAVLRKDIDAIVEHWRSKGIEPGSDEALEVDY